MRNAFEKLSNIVKQEKGALSAEPSNEEVIADSHPPGEVDPVSVPAARGH